MRPLIQLICVLIVATHTVKTAVIPKTVFWPSDIFLHAQSDSIQQEPKQQHSRINFEIKDYDEDDEPTTLGPFKKHNTQMGEASPTSFDQIISEAYIQNPLRLSSVALQNSNEATGEQPQSSSNEVQPSVQNTKSSTHQQNSAEVSGIQQQNSAEISGTQQQQNSAEISNNNQNSAEVGVPTTIDPFNSREETSKPQKIASTHDSEVHDGSSKKKEGTNSLATNGQSLQEESSSSPQPGNAGVVNTAAGTQPFFPGSTNVNEEQKESDAIDPVKPVVAVVNVGGNNNDEGTNSATDTLAFNPQSANGQHAQEKSNIATQVGVTAAGTQAFFPESTNIKEEQEHYVADTENAVVGIASASGTQPFYPQSTNVDRGQVGDIFGQQEDDADIHTISPNRSDDNKEPQKSETATALNGNTGIAIVAGTEPFFSQTVIDGNEPGLEERPVHHANPEDASMISGIEPFIDGEVGPLTKISGLEPIFSDQNNGQNSLRDILAQVGVTNTFEDRLVEQAKQYFISIWNLEANRFDAPYLEVTDVWPEIGMVYMPTINQMSSQIQNSDPVKDAAKRLTAVWKDRKPQYHTSSLDGALRLDFSPDSLESDERIHIPLPLYRLYSR